MTASEKPWTPEQKLRADCIDEQIDLRAKRVAQEMYARGAVRNDAAAHAIRQVARELASAVSLEKDAEIAELRAELLSVVDELRAEIARLRAGGLTTVERWFVQNWLGAECPSAGEAEVFALLDRISQPMPLHADSAKEAK